MDVSELLIEVIGVSASGVLAPGPLFIANILHGAKRGANAGLKVAYGHSIVELPLIALLAAGIVSSIALSYSYISAISIVGGFAILGFAAFQMLSLRKDRINHSLRPIADHSPFISGIALTALNPFFLVWWFTVGLKLITDSLSFGLVAGIMMVFGFHVWMDYAWLTGTAYLSSRGNALLSSKFYAVLVVSLNGVLVYFGVNFIVSALS